MPYVGRALAGSGPIPKLRRLKQVRAIEVCFLEPLALRVKPAPAVCERLRSFCEHLQRFHQPKR
jgi:hypothetical protein